MRNLHKIFLRSLQNVGPDRLSVSDIPSFLTCATNYGLRIEASSVTMDNILHVVYDFSRTQMLNAGCSVCSRSSLTSSACSNSSLVEHLLQLTSEGFVA